MTYRVDKNTFIAAVLLAATAGLALPATPAAAEGSVGYHATHRSHAFRMGYREGFRDGRNSAVAVVPPGEVVIGRSVAVAPGAANGGVFGNGGVLGLGILGGNGLLGTGVLNGQGALGLGVVGL